MFEGQCASEVLQSAVSEGAEDGDPHGSKDTGIMDGLETMEAPETRNYGYFLQKAGDLVV